MGVGTGKNGTAATWAEGGAFEYEFPQYPLVASPRPTDKLVRYQLHGKEKLNAIPEPTGIAAAGVELDRHKITIADGNSATLVATAVPIAALPPKHKSTVCMVDIAI